jgi:hypothetical protein
MKTFVAAAVVALALGSQARADDPFRPFAGVVPLSPDAPDTRGAARGPTGRALVFDARTGGAVPTVTRLHPVVGSVQRAGHKRFSATTYNPLMGTFGTQTFRR